MSISFAQRSPAAGRRKESRLPPSKISRHQDVQGKCPLVLLSSHPAHDHTSWTPSTWLHCVSHWPVLFVPVHWPLCEMVSPPLHFTPRLSISQLLPPRLLSSLYQLRKEYSRKTVQIPVFTKARCFFLQVALHQRTLTSSPKIEIFKTAKKSIRLALGFIKANIWLAADPKYYCFVFAHFINFLKPALNKSLTRA